MKGDRTREIIAYLIMAMFAYGLVRNPSDQMIQGALIASFSTAIGFYLGGSKIGSDTAAKNADTVSEAARNTAPLPVTVTNEASDPVPVEATQ